MKIIKLLGLLLIMQLTACAESLSLLTGKEDKPIKAEASIQQIAQQTIRADTPLSATLSAATTTRTMTIDGVEIPINNGPIATAAHGMLELNPSIDGTMINYRADIGGIGSSVEKMHIHLGHPTGQGPLIFSLYDVANDGPLENPKQGTLTLADLKLDPETRVLEDLGIIDISTVIDNLQRGNAYVNIHTTRFPSGELRGQVVIAGSSESDLPTPLHQ